MDAVCIENVSKSYGQKRALADLSLAVPEGSLFGLIGPNGAGKTTSIRVTLGIYGADAGTIRILGRPMSEDLKTLIGYLPEERGLYTRMKVGEMLVFAGGIKGVRTAEAARRARAWLERLGLADTWEKKVQDLSKGMQQKAQFVATVLHEPDLLILDEPFSGLDPINTDVLRDIMLEFHRKGRTIIFSTHIMETVERLCDRVCMIHLGRKVLDGTLKEIKARYGRSNVAIAFEGDGGFLNDHPLVRSVRDFKGYVEVTLADGADPQRLLRDAVSRVRLSRFEIMEPSMHAIFVDEVGGEGGADVASTAARGGVRTAAN